MASEAVNRILSAEADVEQKNAEARQRSEELVTEAKGRASRTIQKKLGDAAVEAGKMRAEYEKKLEEYSKKAENACDTELGRIKNASERNMKATVDRIIAEFF